MSLASPEGPPCPAGCGGSCPEGCGTELVRLTLKNLNGKPVLLRKVKTILNLFSEQFQHKLLCDGLVFNIGDACGFTCVYCYVKTSMLKLVHDLIDQYNEENGTDLVFEDVQILRANSTEVLKGQLVDANGNPKFNDADDTRVVFTSTTVDPASSKEVLQLTAEACNLILAHTNWQIRILSKSALIKELVEMIPKEHHDRLIFGLSIGTLDDKLARAIERGTSSPSKRIETLRWFQDNGFRTFGMLCPSLPQEDYDKFSKEACEAIRADQCEHVWAEVMNVRGKSLTKTTEALREKGFEKEAELLERVSNDKDEWEKYARMTFEAHVKHVPKGKLRYLQYVTEKTADWWAERRDEGAVPLGKVAEMWGILAPGTSDQLKPLPGPTKQEREYREEREKIVEKGRKTSLEVAVALYELHGYRDGIIWRREGPNFGQYCERNLGINAPDASRKRALGEFVHLLKENPAPEGVERIPPRSEGQVREFLSKVPPKEWVQRWDELCKQWKGRGPASMTTAVVNEFAAKHASSKKKTKVADGRKRPVAVKVAKAAKSLRELEWPPEKEVEAKKLLEELEPHLKALEELAKSPEPTEEKGGEEKDDA